MARKHIDLTGHVCPYPFVKSMLVLEGMAPGEELEIVVDYAPALRSTPRSLKAYGHMVTEVVPQGNKWLLVIRKGRPPG